MILNISSYHFVTLHSTRLLQMELREVAAQLNLKGSIMLTPEGINLMLSGSETEIQAFCKHLTAKQAFQTMQFKQSHSEAHSFKKLLVKCRTQLVPGMPDIRPDKGDVAPNLSPETLKQWYDEGRDFIMIDTRNDYELALGTFENAVDLNLKQFSELSAKLDTLDENIKQKPVVLFCTGGIRCEKAAPKAKQLGFKNVYQLEGGILTYFERCGKAHYQGDCFVFDERVALTEELKKGRINL